MSFQIASEKDSMNKYYEELSEYWERINRGEEGCIAPIRPETEEDREYWKLQRQLLLDEINNRLVYDPATKKKIRYKGFEEKYGTELADKAIKAKEEEGGRLGIEDYKAVMAIHNGKETADRNKVDRSKKSPSKAQKKSSQFILMSFELLDNPQYLKNYASKPLVYQYLRRFIVRGKQRDDKLSLYEKYYQNGKLVSCLSQRRLSEEFGLSTNTIGKYIKQLKSDGVIKLIVVPGKDAWDGKKHHVYELGTCKDGNERFYLDEKYGLS